MLSLSLALLHLRSLHPEGEEGSISHPLMPFLPVP